MFRGSLFEGEGVLGGKRFYLSSPTIESGSFEDFAAGLQSLSHLLEGIQFL